MWYVITAVVSWFVGVWCSTKADERKLGEQLKAGTVVHKDAAYRVERWEDA